MKKLMMAAFVATACIATSCSDDDVNDPINPIGDIKEYQLHSVSDPDISGTITFMRNEDNSTTVEIDLDGTTSGQTYPAHIHDNSAIEIGDIVITLNSVDGETGESTTTFSTLDDGTTQSYTDMLDFDGYVNVHLNETEMTTLVAQGDIGGNELTGESKTYDLTEVDVPGTSGSATFEKRKNGDILATLTVAPTTDGEMHPAHIHMNTAAETGSIVFTFESIDGATGNSVTNMETLDDGTSIDYDDLLNFDGYINVHKSALEMESIIAQIDIGQNELTGQNTVYVLDAVANPTFSGEAVFAERANGETLITISLVGAVAGETYPAHIHEGTASAASVTISVELNDVDGDTGISKTNVAELDNGGGITYEGLLDYDGYLDVHVGLTDIIAADIGVNVN